MNLLLDLGNSRLKWAMRDGALQDGRALSYGEDFPAVLDHAFAALAKPARVVVASVAGTERNDALAGWLKAHWGLAPEFIVPRSRQCGVTSSYDEPARLGADRWAALIAAWARTASAACVVDAGTAVTVDVLDATGVFRGGVILPGLSLQRAALLRGTREISAAGEGGGSCLALNTADAVSGGMHYGLAGAIDRILDEQAAVLGVAPRVLLTGGDSEPLLPLLRHRVEHIPQLVLEGVGCIAEESA
ncbi:MAG: type III pantothenate kinase [Gammaproteobacteria bacterium]|nr:type III pantothenate kinase [Gammaproteobacteria bacterium]